LPDRDERVEPEPLRLLAERPRADDDRLDAGELPFRVVREGGEEEFRDDHPEDRVAEELEALVARVVRGLARRVGQRLAEERGVLEPVADRLLARDQSVRHCPGALPSVLRIVPEAARRTRSERAARGPSGSFGPRGPRSGSGPARRREGNEMM